MPLPLDDRRRRRRDPSACRRHPRRARSHEKPGIAVDADNHAVRAGPLLARRPDAFGIGARRCEPKSGPTSTSSEASTPSDPRGRVNSEDDRENEDTGHDDRYEDGQVGGHGRAPRSEHPRRRAVLDRQRQTSRHVERRTRSGWPASDPRSTRFRTRSAIGRGGRRMEDRAGILVIRQVDARSLLST